MTHHDHNAWLPDVEGKDLHSSGRTRRSVIVLAPDVGSTGDQPYAMAWWQCRRGRRPNCLKPENFLIFREAVRAHQGQFFQKIRFDNLMFYWPDASADPTKKDYRFIPAACHYAR